MKEKKAWRVYCRELPEGARQQDGEAFRSGASNDEFDGYARYSAISWPKGKLGGNAGNMLSSLFGDGSFFSFSRRASWRLSCTKEINI